MTAIDFLDALDLDLHGFEDALPDSSILFFPVHVDESQFASTSASPKEMFRFDDLMEPRKWLAARPPVWDSVATHSTDASPCESLPGLTIRVFPPSPTRLFAKENVPSPSPSPTERSFARLRDLGSSYALKALNSAFSSPDRRHRVLI